MAVRWVCPSCGKGVNAPSRMNALDVRRFCLDCSAEAPRLVERISPRLERQRSAAAAKAKERATAKRAATTAEKHRSKSARVDGQLVRIDRLVAAAWALPLRRAEAPRAPMPEIEVRQGTKSYSTGRCFYGWKITFTFGRNPDMAEAVAIVLHEVAHELAYRAKGEDVKGHGSAFWSYFRGLATEWFNVQAPVLEGDRFERQDAMVRFARECLA